MIRVWVWVWVWFTCLQKYHYNKAPLIRLAMVTYWRKNNHELYQLIWKNLVIFDEYLLENAHISDQRQMIMTIQKKCRRPQRLHFRADKLKATFETTLQQIIILCFHESTFFQHIKISQQFPFHLNRKKQTCTSAKCFWQRTNET